MTFLKKTLLCLVLPAAICALTGCEQPGDQNRGTYTAARHSRTGSNIPQASDVNSATSVYSPGYDPNAVGGVRTNASGAGPGGR